MRMAAAGSVHDAALTLALSATPCECAPPAVQQAIAKVML